jgi:predicted nucleic acid-binding protein
LTKVVIIDASVALAWCFPDEGNEYADKVLIALEGISILVPAIWALEVTNAILVGERAKRLRQPEILHFSTLLQNLSLVQEVQPVDQDLTNVLPLARDHDLSAYAASYLDLALRHSAPLATLDRKLRKAAQKAGAKLFTGASDAR